MVSRIYKTNLYTVYKYNCDQCIDPPCLVKCSGQGGGFVSCSPKYIIKNIVDHIYIIGPQRRVKDFKGIVQRKLRSVESSVNQ